jgi:hypothetical protein
MPNDRAREQPRRSSICRAWIGARENADENIDIRDIGRDYGVSRFLLPITENYGEIGIGSVVNANRMSDS